MTPQHPPHPAPSEGASVERTIPPVTADDPTIPPPVPGDPAVPPVAPGDPATDAAPLAATGAMRTERTSGVVKATGTMAIATLASRATGFVAKVVALAFLGAWVVSDSYNLANTLPNIVFELLIGGVLTSVAIPLLSRARSDPDGGVAYTQRLMTLAVVALAIATSAALVTAPWLIRLYQGSDGRADATMATELAYLLLPQIFFYGLAALFGAILNTEERFATPAWAPVINNLVVIGVGAVLLTTHGGVVGDGGMVQLSRAQFLLLGGGTTAGIVLQAAVMLPALRRAGFRFRWRFGLDTRMYEAGRLMGWAIVYTLISQAGYLVITNITVPRHDGSYTLYSYGSMLFQLPYGILGVSLLTAIMPRMSRHAADGDMGLVKHDMGLANRLSAVALLPVTAAMVALAVPLTVVAVRYGRVTNDAAHTLALTLAAFAIGLLPLAITLVQMRVFYAMKDGRTPTIINAIMVAVRIPLLLAAAALPHDWVVPGLAAAMSVSYVVGVVAGEVWLHVRFGSMGFARTLDTIGRSALASVVGGVAAYLVTDRLLGSGVQPSLIGAIGDLAVGGAVGLVVVGALLIVLRVHEVDVVRHRAVALLRRRAGRLTGQPAGQPAAAPPPGPAASFAPSPARSAPPVAPSATEPPAGSPPPGSPLTGPGGQTWDDGSQTRAAPPPAAPGAHHEPSQGQESVTDDNSTSATAGPGAGSKAADAFFSPGMVVGERYRLTRRVTYDAVGNEFWLARDTVLPRDMAVTLLPSTDPTSTTVTHSLRIGRLHQPGLPQLLDMGEVGSASYLAGQWVDGATLIDLLRDGPLEPAITARLTAGLADAVAAVHEAGFALGEIHPALVRVALDGQVRLSHVVARAADPADDVRAVGALTYLMLTATWPLTGDDAPVGIPPSPRRGSRELAATKVVPGADASLSALAEDALHAGSRGPGIDEVASRAHAFGAPGAGRSGYDARSGGRGSAPVGAVAADRAARPAAVSANTAPPAVKRDRRLKLTIAGVMLTVLSVLIVIALSSVVKQVLANIVAPIEAADHQQLITVTTPTTTRTVAGLPGETTADSSSTGTTAPAVPVKITGATVYDPQGTPPADYASWVDRAYDGDPASYWPTWVYKQQFGPGGIKDGVGLMLTLDGAVSPRSVTVATSTPGTVVEVRSAASPKATLDSTTVLGTATLTTDPVTITLSNAPVSANLVIWITKLAPYQGDTASNKGQFQSTLSEISITK